MSNTLDSAWKKLHTQWRSAKSQWHDKAQRDFEQQYWTQLEQETQRTIHEIHNLLETIRKAKQSVK